METMVRRGQCSSVPIAHASSSLMAFNFCPLLSVCCRRCVVRPRRKQIQTPQTLTAPAHSRNDLQPVDSQSIRQVFARFPSLCPGLAACALLHALTSYSYIPKLCKNFCVQTEQGNTSEQRSAESLAQCLGQCRYNYPSATVPMATCLVHPRGLGALPFLFFACFVLCYAASFPYTSKYSTPSFNCLLLASASKRDLSTSSKGPANYSRPSWSAADSF